MSNLFYFFISWRFSLFCSFLSPSLSPTLCRLRSEDVKNLQCFFTKKYGYMQSIMAEICITWVGFSCSSVPSLFEMLVVVLVPTGALSAAMKMNKLYEQLYKYLILFTKRMWTMCNVMSESIHVSFPFDCAMSWMMPTCSHVHTAHRIRQHKAKDESH